MIFLPFTLFLEEPLSLEYPFDGTETDNGSLFLQQMMNHLAASSVLQAHGYDGIDGLLIESAGMGRGAGTLGRNKGFPVLGSPLHPLADCAGGVACIPRHFTDFPALSDELYRFPADAWKMRIGAVGHSGNNTQGVSKLLNHYEGIDKKYEVIYTIRPRNIIVAGQWSFHSIGSREDH